MDTLRAKLRRLWMRLTSPLRRGRSEDAFDTEIETHLAMHIADGVRAGLSAEEARRQALIRLGGAEQARQAYREGQRMPQLEIVWQDIRFGARVLFKSPGFTVTAALVLALGIGATTAIYSAVKAVLLAPLPYKDPGSIVAVWTANPARGDEPLPSSPGDFEAWKQRSGVFEDLAPAYDNEATLTGAGAPLYLMGYDVAANYLRILGVQPAIGRLFTDQEDRPNGPKVVLLSDHLWRTTFSADPGIVGRAITLDGAAYTVLGVMPRGFDYPTNVEFWMPVGMAAGDFEDFKHTYVRILGRLKHRLSPKQAQKTLNAFGAQLIAAHPDTDTGNRIVVVPLREQLDGDIRQPLLVLMGAVVFVLLIACANTAGLALARNNERRKEIAVRLVLGATRQRLLRQFLTESLLLAALGGAAGMGLAALGARFLVRLFPNDVANLSIPNVTEIPIDRGVLLFALAVTLLTTFLFGVAPVLKAMQTGADLAMKDSERGGTGSRWSSRSRSAVVVAEVSLSLVLLTAAGLLAASFRKVVEADLGFRPDHVVSLEVFLPQDRYPFNKEPAKTRLFVQETVRRMNALPGVESAAATNYLPLSGFWGVTNFLLRGQAPPRGGLGPEADNLVITPEYLRTMGIAVLRGRGFTTADNASAQHVAMINRSMADQFFKGKDPVGQELNLGTAEQPDWWQIVGVTGDVKAFGQDKPTHLDVYRPFDQLPYPLIAFTLRTAADPGAMTKVAEQAMWSVDPGLAVLKAVTMEALTAQSLAVRRTSSVLIGGFAALALLLACIGIYGLMAYAVSRRTREIGVRMALGAKRADVLRMVLGSGLRLASVGIAIGLAGALASSRLLGSLLFDTSPINPLIFCLAAALLAATAVLASFLPARRAASIEPMQALRTE
ncbi:MAG: ABC transporter permease [Terracidiphilus sp.]